MTLGFRKSAPTLVLVALFGAGLPFTLPRDARAQDRTAAPTVEELKQRLAEIERTLATGIATLRQQIAVLEATPPGASPPVSAPAGQGSGSREAEEETFARERESVARVNIAPLDPALQGFGTHQLKSGDEALATRVQFAAKYDFFRKRLLAQ
jgi:hypothetical protein